MGKTDRTFECCFIIDDDDDVLLSVRLLLRGVFDRIETFSSPAEAVPAFERITPDLILLDANFGRSSTDSSEGLDWLSRFLARDPDLSIVMVTAHGGVQVAVEAMKRGATDFVLKPWNNDRFVAIARNAARLHGSRAAATARGEPGQAATPAGSSPLLGNSPAMQRVLSLVARAAPTDANILILGENGTGKELVAREIHRQSRRSQKPLVTVDLGAVPETLFESELFGHRKGSFTDAKTDRTGRMQAAEGGTLFLDEIGNLPLHLQPKLLTALEQRQVLPVGANTPEPIDVRVVAATNMPLHELGDERRFRQDLLFRLKTIEIELPPLRNRREDIPLLMHHFLDLYAQKYERPRLDMPDEVMSRLTAHEWPGNVRALRHAAERAVILSQADAYHADDFALGAGGGGGPAVPHSESGAPFAGGAPADGDLNLDKAEKQIISSALVKNGYNISAAAADLGLSRAALYRRMEKYGL